MKQTRKTPQKQLIRELLQDNYNHPTAEEIYQLAREHTPSISRGTIYRNLNLLTEQNEISRLSTPHGPDHYDFSTHNHYHFLCERCNILIDIDIPYNDTLNNIAPKGCNTMWHKLLLVGICENCREN